MFPLGCPVWAESLVGVCEGLFVAVQNSAGWTGDFGKYLTHRFLKGTKEFVYVSKREINVRKASQFSS